MDHLFVEQAQKAQKLAIIVITAGRFWGKQSGTPRASCPEPCPDGFWVTPMTETPNLSGQLMAVLSHHHSEVCPDVHREPPMFGSLESGPIASGCGTGHHWKEHGSVLIAGSLQTFVPIDEFPPWSLLRSGQSQLSQPFLIGQMLQSLHHPCDPFLDCLQYVHVSFVLGGPYLDPALQMWPYQCLADGKDYLPIPAGFAEACQQDNLFQSPSSSK